MSEKDIFTDADQDYVEDSAAMANMWDLGQYVEEHPDAYEQRWRLAKKLYLACEYRLALEHLQVLKNEWIRKQNVLRYLGATYYRLGRYEESVRELEEAIEIWPDEVGLREQLARVLETAGDHTRASAVWEQVQRLDPDHPMAGKAAERLISHHDASPESDLRIQESDSGIDIAPKRICPACGAQNSIEFDRCWQCRTPLVHGAVAAIAPLPMPVPMPVAQPLAGIEEDKNPGRRVANILAGLLLFALLTGGIIGGISALPSQEAPPGIDIVPTVYAYLYNALFSVRLVVGLVVLALWPLVLFLTLNTASSNEPHPLVVAAAGLFLGALGNGLAWTPPQVLPHLLGLTALVSFLTIFAFFNLTLRDTLIVWLVQLLIIPAAAAGAILAVEGPSALLSAPATVAYAAKHDSAKLPAFRYEAPPASVVASSDQYAIQWNSTGSPWLDQKLSNTQFEMTHVAKGNPLSFDLRAEGHTVLFEKTGTSPFRIGFPKLKPGIPYTLSVRGDPDQVGTPIGLAVYSLLETTITSTQQPENQ
jgi:tetratricopeptide (TPR) repeat protein